MLSNISIWLLLNFVLQTLNCKHITKWEFLHLIAKRNWTLGPETAVSRSVCGRQTLQDGEEGGWIVSRVDGSPLGFFEPEEWSRWDPSFLNGKMKSRHSKIPRQRAVYDMYRDRTYCCNGTCESLPSLVQWKIKKLGKNVGAGNWRLFPFRIFCKIPKIWPFSVRRGSWGGNRDERPRSHLTADFNHL